MPQDYIPPFKWRVAVSNLLSTSVENSSWIPPLTRSQQSTTVPSTRTTRLIATAVKPWLRIASSLLNNSNHALNMVIHHNNIYLPQFVTNNLDY